MEVTQVKTVFRAYCMFSLVFAAGIASADTTPEVFVPYPEVAGQDPAEVPSLAAALDGEYVTPATFDGNYVALSNTSDAVCGDCCLAECPPLWTVRAGAVILHRSRPDDDVIASSPGGLFEVSAGGDFEFGWDGGVDLYVARDLGCGYGVEARYFGVDSRAGFGYDFTVDFDFGGGTIINLLDVDAAYRSNLDSAEINLRIDGSPRVTWLAGFRYVELQELLNYDVTVLGFLDNDIRWATSNHLYGGQLGADLSLWNLNSPLSINSIFKAGVYGNDASNRFSFDRPVLPTIVGGANTGDVAFVGEIDINFALHVTPHFALTGGYQLMWINGVALSSDQAAVALDQLDVDLITTSGDLFYHGALAGAEFTW
jgi:hypothetical protein